MRSSADIEEAPFPPWPESPAVMPEQPKPAPYPPPEVPPPGRSPQTLCLSLDLFTVGTQAMPPGGKW